MSIELLHDKSIRITEYSFAEYTISLAKVVKAGYSPILDDNNAYPIGYSGLYTCVAFLDSALTDAQRVVVGLMEEINQTKAQTSTETALNDDSSPVEAKGDTNVPEVKETAKTAPKTASRSTKK